MSYRKPVRQHGLRSLRRARVATWAKQANAGELLFALKRRRKAGYMGFYADSYDVDYNYFPKAPLMEVLKQSDPKARVQWFWKGPNELLVKVGDKEIAIHEDEDLVRRQVPFSSVLIEPNPYNDDGMYEYDEEDR